MKDRISIHSLKNSKDIAHSISYKTPVKVQEEPSELSVKLLVVDSFMSLVKSIKGFERISYRPVVSNDELTGVEMILGRHTELADTNYSTEGQVIVDLTKAFQRFL